MAETMFGKITFSCVAFYPWWAIYQIGGFRNVTYLNN